jgi:UDP-N-acetylglucosamine--N-acetylmuramyl-(pentapeptide) pyrophosphoryl-undecaprenol N-acetylglucosamine transferase
VIQRLVLTTGGTGGHIFPALSVAEEVRVRNPRAEILFVGGEKGPEGRIAAQAGIPFQGLPAQGVLGRGISSVLSLGWMTRSAFRSFSLLRSFKPEVVLGLGGYAGFIPTWVATLMGIPAAIHEQNSYPGVTNRILGRKVDRVLLSFTDRHGFFPLQRVRITGNPVRKSILELRSRNSQPGKGTHRKVLVLGGSQGAKAINDAVLQALPTFCTRNFRIWHQSGPADLERVRAGYDQHPSCLERIEGFIEDMAAAYSWADLIICRAGASTLAELTAVGRASILIPFPYATHDHQLSNAKHLENAGAAMVLVQSYLDEVNLARAADDLFSMPGKLQEMANAARALGRPDAAAAIVGELEFLAAAAQKKKKGR